MTTYAIGDIQGCLDELKHLLDVIHFEPAHDTLWFVGDLVNRGAQSLETLRFIHALGPAAVVVLGNHDLHLLAVASGQQKVKAHDTIDAILCAPDKSELLTWLRQQPLLHYDATWHTLMVHAGLPPQWDLATAIDCAEEVQQCLRGPDYADFFAHMYGNTPAQWDPALTGWERLRFITNALTRLRFCSADGVLNLRDKGTVKQTPPLHYPWFDVPGRATESLNIVFGHWAALRGQVNKERVFAIDTGCVWGHCLTAFRLPDGKRMTCDCTHLKRG